MKIASAEVVVSSPSRNFVTLVVKTDEGINGIGDATLNGRELAAASYLRDHVAPLLLGRDPHRIEDTWQFLYRGAYWRCGPVTMAAIAAVDMALWDIKGKVAGLPVYELLGGASRDGLLAYGHASGTSASSLSESIHAHMERGYRALRVQTAVPGIRRLYGVASQGQLSGMRYDYEPAGRGPLPAEEDWDSSAYLRHVPGVFEASGRSSDRNCLCFTTSTIGSGRSRPPGWRDASSHTTSFGSRTAPLRSTLKHSASSVITPRSPWLLARYSTPSGTSNSSCASNSSTTSAPRRHILVGSLRCANSPTSPANSRFVRASTERQTCLRSGSQRSYTSAWRSTTSGSQEYMEHSDPTKLVFRQDLTFRAGYLHPGHAPGLGVDFDPQLAAQFPYQPAYLPVSRLRDGTIHDW